MTHVSSGQFSHVAVDRLTPEIGSPWADSAYVAGYQAIAALAMNTHKNAAIAIKTVVGKYCVLNLIICIVCPLGCHVGYQLRNNYNKLCKS
jgi:hypothetical protein